MSFTITKTLTPKKTFSEIGISIDMDAESVSLTYEARQIINLKKGDSSTTGTAVFAVTEGVSGDTGSYQLQIEYTGDGVDPFVEAESQLKIQLESAE